MRQVASAERIADALGTRTTMHTTVQRDVVGWLSSDTGMRSEREVEQYLVSPNVIRGLGRGEAVVWRRLRGTVDRVTIVAPDPSGPTRRSEVGKGRTHANPASVSLCHAAGTRGTRDES